MTTHSQSDLAERVLKDLGITDARETPDADDLAWATETVASECAMLRALGIPIWNGSDMAVPEEYLTAVARRVALAVAPSFGLIDLATAQLAMREAERYLTVLAAPRSRPLQMRSDDIRRTGSTFNFTTGV